MASQQETPLSNSSGREIVVTRLLNAPRELVFRVFTEPGHIAQWWGPTGFKNTINKMDVRPGGTWSFTMHGPDGVDYPNLVVYDEIVKPERLVYTHGSAGDPDLFKAIITFEDAGGGKTLFTMKSIFRSATERDFMAREFNVVEGAEQNADRLQAHLAKLSTPKAEFSVTRIINAPRTLVFEAWIRPEHLPHWWGGNNYTLPVCEVDLRTGGAYRFCMHAPEGHDYLVSGVYHEINAPERIVFSCGLENEDLSHDAMWSVTFEEVDGKTLLTVNEVLFDASKARDGAAAGLAICLARLALYLESGQ